MDDNLSTVPPVKPRDRPDIFATGTPAAAAMGAVTSVTVSPTPPVECLSTLIPGIDDRSACLPEAAMAMVSAAVSAAVIPWK